MQTLNRTPFMHRQYAGNVDLSLSAHHTVTQPIRASRRLYCVKMPRALETSSLSCLKRATWPKPEISVMVLFSIFSKKLFIYIAEARVEVYTKRRQCSEQRKREFSPYCA